MVSVSCCKPANGLCSSETLVVFVVIFKVGSLKAGADSCSTIHYVVTVLQVQLDALLHVLELDLSWSHLVLLPDVASLVWRLVYRNRCWNLVVELLLVLEDLLLV